MILKFLGISYSLPSFKFLEKLKKESKIKINLEYINELNSNTSVLELPDGKIISLNSDIISNNMKEIIFSNQFPNHNLSSDINSVFMSKS